MVIMRAQLNLLKLPWIVESRGVIAKKGAGIEATTLRVLQKLGYTVPEHRATPLTYLDRHSFDYFFAMDEWVRCEAEAILKAPPPKVYRLLDFIGKPGDIADPYQAEERIIEDTVERLRSAIYLLLEKLLCTVTP